MSDKSKSTFPIATTIPIRQAGGEFDEEWLKKQILANPSILTLGELDVVSRERIQWKNGRLDMLLRDDTGEKMYEVEVMLGKTDETHIIRTIEYWDNEKRKYPQRQHFPVLVAESFEKRFFNIIHLFSHTVPLIAVQVNLVEVAGQKSLHFSKIIDVYQEPEDEDAAMSTIENVDENFWNKKASWTVEAANTLLEIVTALFPNAQLHFVKHYIAIEVNGENHFWIIKRGGGKSLIEFWFTPQLLPKATEYLDKAGISSTPTKYDTLVFLMTGKMLKENEKCILELAKLSKTSWDQ
jgi:hypothetical protein